MKKLNYLFIVTSIFTICISVKSYAGVWENKYGGWQYNVKNDEQYKDSEHLIELKNGEKYYCNGSLTIDGKTYYFDSKGFMEKHSIYKYIFPNFNSVYIILDCLD